MSGTGLTEAPLVERPEIVEYALQLMTPALGEPSSTVLPECVEGPEAARLVARRYGLSERHARRYVAQARDLIAAHFAEELPARADLLAKISLAVVREAYRDRQWTPVNGAIKNLCLIYGIEAKVAVKGDGMSALLDALKVTPGERDAEIAALEAKEREGAADGADPG